MVKQLPSNAGDTRGSGLIPGLGRYPGGGHGNPLHYSCLENPMHRGAWWATVHGITKSQTRLKFPTMHIRVGLLCTESLVQNFSCQVTKFLEISMKTKRPLDDT